MNETKYLVDNNALIGITRSRVSSAFFLTHCFITSDVLREAGDHPDRATLRSRTLDIHVSIIERIREVMMDEHVSSTELVDLYANKGAADPGLIATILEMTDAGENQFFPDKWVLVTNDLAVVNRALKFSVATISATELAHRIDASR